MNALAKRIQLAGAKNHPQDTVLAHITPREAALLKLLGGAGTKDPDTGLLHFYDSGTGNDNGTGGYSDSEDTSDATTGSTAGQSEGVGDASQGSTAGEATTTGDGYSGTDAAGGMSHQGLTAVDDQAPTGPTDEVGLAEANAEAISNYADPTNQDTWGQDIDHSPEAAASYLDANGLSHTTGQTIGSLADIADLTSLNQNYGHVDAGRGGWGRGGYNANADQVTGITGLVADTLGPGKYSPDAIDGWGWQAANSIEQSPLAMTALGFISPALAAAYGLAQTAYGIGRGFANQNFAQAALGLVNAAVPSTRGYGLFAGPVASYIDNLAKGNPNAMQNALGNFAGRAGGQIGGLLASQENPAFGRDGAKAGGMLASAAFNAIANATPGPASPDGPQSSDSYADQGSIASASPASYASASQPSPQGNALFSLYRSPRIGFGAIG